MLHTVRGPHAMRLPLIPRASALLRLPAMTKSSASWTRMLATPSSSSPSTMDAENVAHFSRLSSQWWDEKGEFALLHAMNPVRLDFMRAKMQEVGEWDETRELLLARERGDREMQVQRKWEQGGKWLQGLNTLDVGCGGGLLSESLARLGANVTGIDASPENVTIAKLHAQHDPSFSRGTPRYENIMAEDLLARRRKQNEEGFDVVCAMEVVEHVKEPALFLETLADLLKPGGHLFMSTIARTPLSYFLTILMAEQVLRLVTPGTHNHAQYINPSELVDFFSTKVPWIGQTQAQSQPARVQYETRGVAYLPWKAGWELAPRGSGRYGSELANYFFWVRKPLAVT